MSGIQRALRNDKFQIQITTLNSGKMVFCLGDSLKKALSKSVDMILIVTLNIVLPTLDTYSDLSIIMSLVQGQDYTYAAALLTPFLLNYGVMLYTWWRLDESHSLTLLLPALLNLYPQTVAGKVLLLIWKDDPRAQQKKVEMEQDLSEHEAVLEALPTLTILSCMLALDEKKILEISGVVSDGIYLANVLRQHKFWISFHISIFSASFGMAKCLKNGVARILPDVGFCSKGFALILVSILLTIFGNGFLLKVMIEKNNGYFLGPQTLSSYHRLAINIALHSLPGLVISVITTYNYRSVWRTMLAHPSIFVIPIFTYYTFETNNIGFQKKKVEEIELRLSKRWSIANLVCKTIGFLIEAAIIGEGDFSVIASNPVSGISTLPTVLAGIVSTVLVTSSCCSCLPTSFHYAIYKVKPTHNSLAMMKKETAKEETSNDDIVNTQDINARDTALVQQFSTVTVTVQ